MQTIDETGAAERITVVQPGFEHHPASWSADGRTLLFVNVKAGIKDTIWTAAVDGGHRTAQVLAVRGSNQMDPVISPDQRWIAYMAEGEAGDSRPQVYVQPFPVTSRKIQVSRDGGDMPVWARDGRRLFYRGVTSRQIMAVAIRTQPTLVIDTPVVVVDNAAGDGGYDVAPNGSVLAALDDRPATAQQIKVVLNWLASPAARAERLGVSARVGNPGQLSSLRRRTVPVSVSLPIDR